MSKKVTLTCEHGGAREGAGRPEATSPKVMVTRRLEQTTVDRIERFARERKVNWTVALETIVEEYTLVLDGIILPGRWRPEAFKRPGLKMLGMRPPKALKP